MAVSLEDYLKDSKTIQAARKKYAAAQAALVTAQRASQGLPTGGSEALRSQVERRLADAQIQLDEAEKSLRQEESVQTKFYNTNVNTIQSKADAKQSKSDQNNLADAYAMRQRLIAANQSTAAIDRSIQEINEKVKGVFGFIPPYTLSSTKKRPHYILNIENFPNRDSFKQKIDCFIPFTGDLLTHVVEKSNEIIRELVLNEDGDIIFTTLDWDKIKDNFNLNSVKKVKEVKEIVLNGDFKEQIELIKASKYYNEAFDLVNIKVDGDKFRFKATSRYNCVICKREHIKNNQHLLVDCSKGGIILSCRDIISILRRPT